MIVFNNTSLEVNEGDAEVIIEIDPAASDITEITEVEISTLNGTALAIDFTNDGVGLDYTAIDSLVVDLDPNDPDSFVFPINITDDAIAETDEDFQFQVTATDDSTLNGTATITILDDDGIDESEATAPVVEGLPPEISINNVAQPEGDSGNTDFEFTVSLSQPSEELITVDYATADGSAESEAVVDGFDLLDEADYLPQTGTIEFAPGETEQTISIEVLTDDNFLASEAPLETFLVNLADATNASLEQLAGIGTILNDDLETEKADTDLPVIQLSDLTLIEGDAAVNIQALTVNLLDSEGEPVVATEDIVFSYSTADLDAVASLDYEFIASQAATIEEGESSTAIELTILGDEIIEADESLSVILSGIDTDVVQFANAQSELETVITIEDDDTVTDSDEPEEVAADDEPDAAIDTDELDDSEEETDADDTDDEESDSEDDAEEETDADADADADAENDAEAETEVDDADNEESTSTGTAADLETDLDVADFPDNTVFRLINSATGAYLYTDSEAEIESRENAGGDRNFELENPSFVGADPDAANAEDVYRFFNTETEGYFYTTSEIERDAIVDNLNNFIFEDVAFSAFETNVAESIPVYRFYDSSTGIHFYTADETENSFVEDNLANYSSEGIAFYAQPWE
ncbi:MAG: Calx-beta domain-containing protein [Cyanobacteria bacterium J06648_1]